MSGKFVDQTFNVVQRWRSRAPLEIHWRSLGKCPPVKNHCYRSLDLSESCTKITCNLEEHFYSKFHTIAKSIIYNFKNSSVLLSRWSSHPHSNRSWYELDAIAHIFMRQALYWSPNTLYLNKQSTIFLFLNPLHFLQVSAYSDVNALRNTTYTVYTKHMPDTYAKHSILLCYTYCHDETRIDREENV